MPVCTFRSDVGTPQGSIHPVDLGLRVLASLEDAQAAGIAVRYDWTLAEVGADGHGDYVVLDVEWPQELGPGGARHFIDRHFVAIQE